MEDALEVLIRDKLANHCVAGGQVPSLTLDQRLADLPLDSLTLLEIVYELEDQLGVTVDDQGLALLKTVGDLVKLVTHAQPVV